MATSQQFVGQLEERIRERMSDVAGIAERIQKTQVHEMRISHAPGC